MRQYTVSLLLVLVIIFKPIMVGAESVSLEISGNGAESVSEIQSQNTQELNTVQDNQTQIDNSIEISPDTGNNQANNNTTSDINIQTGDTTITTDVNNQVNHNQLDLDLCCAETNTSEVKIANNGEGSQNSVALGTTNQLVSVQTNSVRITNSIETSTNTGNNRITANNASNISLVTGNIFHQESVVNQGNTNQAKIQTPAAPGLVVTIKNNGSGSGNQVAVNYGYSTSYQVNNLSEVVNLQSTKLNTGGNTIWGNLASNIAMITGDIVSKVSVKNILGHNIAQISLCCQDGDDKPYPTPKPSPTPTPPDHPGEPDGEPGPSNGNGDADGNGNGNGNGGGNGDSHDGGGGIGGLLPVTGSNLNSLMVANLMLLLLGIGLRWRVWRIAGYQYQISLVLAY